MAKSKKTAVKKKTGKKTAKKNNAGNDTKVKEVKKADKQKDFFLKHEMNTAAQASGENGNVAKIEPDTSNQ